ncbi:MAG: enolase C-terminal domain-like protein [Gemmataceae bacterium]
MGAVRVVGLSVHLVEIPLRRAVRHASHIRNSTDNIIVRCTLSDGSIGWGEGVPREYVTGESAETAIDLLKQADLSKLPPCSDFAAAVKLAEQLALPSIPGDDRQCRGNAARCALELAILDAYGRSFGESLTTATELIAPDLFDVKARVQYSGIITSSRGLKLIAAALGYRLTGFRQVKVKVGIEGYDDVRRLRLLRQLMGRRMGIRLDANEAWSSAEAASRIGALERFALDSVEQPVRHEDVPSLVAVRKQIKTPIMLDESLCSMVDAERAVAGGWCDRFNLRLSKSGGFIPTLRLAEFATRHNIAYQLGCQVGESAILTCAGRHFATSVRGLVAIEGSFDRHLVAEALAFYDHTFGFGGWAPALGGSGHGAMVDESAIERTTRRREVIFG